jgi:uncharacterized protein YgiM (DUF1202 family)
MEGGIAVKKLFVLMLCLAVIVSFPVLGFAMNDGAVVNNPNPQDRLHLRVEPNTSSASLGKYYNGTPVTIVEYRSDGWVKVVVGYPVGPDYADYTGYMLEKYLTSTFDGAADRVKSAMPEYTSASSSWNMYKTPSKNAAYDTYGSGENIRLMGFTDTWWHIAVMRDGEIYRTGFVPANSSFRQPQTAVVNNPNARDRLQLRTDNNSAAASLGKYYNGVNVQVLSYAGGDWAKVRIGSTEGYMMTEYLAFGDDANKVKSAIPTVRTTTDKVNLRETASQNGKVLGKYALGTSVKVWGICGTWLHVAIGSKSGYMLASMLSAVPGEGPGNTVSPVGGRAAKLKADANFRESAGYTGTVLAYLGKGTRVTVQSQNGDWYYVRIGTTEAYGWILKSLVSIE